MLRDLDSLGRVSRLLMFYGAVLADGLLQKQFEASWDIRSRGEKLEADRLVSFILCLLDAHSVTILVKVDHHSLPSKHASKLVY